MPSSQESREVLVKVDKVRQLCGLSRAAFAEILGVHRRTYWRWLEKGDEIPQKKLQLVKRLSLSMIAAYKNQELPIRGVGVRSSRYVEAVTAVLLRYREA